MQDVGEQSIGRYNYIPTKYLEGKTVLEIGAGNREVQLKTRHKEFFMNGDYLGVDLKPPEKTALNIVEGDIRNVSFAPKRFDTILSFETFEHINYRNWAVIFANIRVWLKPDGVFILSVPFYEPAKMYDNDSPHVVFGITEDTLTYFFPSLKITPFPHPFFWGVKGESWIRATLRGMKRVIIRHSFRKHFLFCIWKKTYEGE